MLPSWTYITPNGGSVLPMCEKLAFPHQQKTQSRNTEGLEDICFLFYNEQKRFTKFVGIEVLKDEKSNISFSLLKGKTSDTITQTNRIIHCLRNSQAMLSMLKSKKKTGRI